MQDDFPKKPEKTASGKSPDTVPLHILIVDDDPAHIDFAMRAFATSPEQFRISCAQTLRHARQIIAIDPPDLIISDWMLPDGNGIEILPRRDGHVVTPLIVMTSRGDEKLAVEIMKSGAIDYIVKSLDMFHNLPYIARRALREWENIQKRTLAEEALREREATLETLLNAPNDTIALLDRQGIIVSINDNGAKRLGGTVQEVTGRYAYDLLPAEIVRARKEHIDRVFETGMPVKFDDIRAGLTIHNEIYPVFNKEHSTVERVAIFATDITDKKKTEQVLKESERRFKDLFNNMSSGVAIYDVVVGGEDFIFRDINHSVEIIDQVKKEEVVGHSVLEIFPGVKEFGLFEVFQRVAKTGIAEAHPVAMYKDNRIAGWRENFVYRLPSGEIVAIYEDVTEKKQAEELLRESEERYRALLFGAGIGVGYWSTDGTLLLLNEIGLKRLKGKEEDLIGKTMHELFGDADAEKYLDRIHKSAVSSDPMEYEDYIHLPSGNGWYLSVYTRITGPDGTVKGIQVLSMDVTARKQADEALHDSQSLLEEAMDLAHMANWEFDALTGIFTFNDRFYTLYGTTAEREGGYQMPAEMYAREFVHPDDQYMVADEVNKAIHATDPGYVSILEHRIIRRDGEVRHIVVRFGITKDANGRTIKTHGANQDITERKKTEEELRESEERYRKVIEQSHDGIYIYRGSKFIFVNDRVVEITGYSKEELYEMAYADLIYPDDRAFVMEIAQKRARGEEVSQTYEARIITKDKKVRFLELAVTPIFYEGNYAVLGSARDITEHKAVEEIVRKSEERFRSLIQNSSDMIRILDHDGRITYESPSTQRILGYPPGFFIGNDAWEYVHPDDLERVKTDLREVYDKKNAGIPTEFRIRKADGSYIWVDAIGVNLIGVPGVDGVVITTRPIDERKHLEEALLKSEERLRLALEGADVASWDWNIATGKTVFSDKFYTMLDYEPAEFSPDYQHWVDLIHPDDRKKVIPDLEAQIRTRQPLCEIEYRIKDKHGDWRWVLARGKVTETDEQGNAVRLTGVNIDITGRKLMESEIRSLNTVLEQRVIQRTEQLNTALKEKELLLREIHHRVKNNLQIIASLLSLQSRYIKDEQVLSVLKESQNRVKAMALVHERLYRSENISRISIAEYVKFLTDNLIRFYGVSSQTIKIIIDIKDLNFDINKAIPLGLVFNELVSNSLKHAFPDNRKGEINITGVSGPTGLTFVIQDNGIGLPSGLDWKNTESLGLRLVISLVEQLDGTIELAQKGGTSFTITIKDAAAGAS